MQPSSGVPPGLTAGPAEGFYSTDAFTDAALPFIPWPFAPYPMEMAK